MSIQDLPHGKINGTLQILKKREVLIWKNEHTAERKREDLENG